MCKRHSLAFPFESNFTTPLLTIHHLLSFKKGYVYSKLLKLLHIIIFDFVLNLRLITITTMNGTKLKRSHVMINFKLLGFVCEFGGEGT